MKKDFLIDRREKQSYLSSLLYLTTITFVVFRLFKSMSDPMRISIFWILLIFTSITIVSGSFRNLSSKRKLSHYQLYDPNDILLARLVFNFLNTLFASGVLLILFRVLGEMQLQDPILFFKALSLTILGIVSALTLVSSLTVYSSEQTTLLTVLSLPLLMPVLFIGIKVSMVSEKMIFDTAVNSNLLMLFGIDMAMIAMGFIFISVTWKA